MNLQPAGLYTTSAVAVSGDHQGGYVQYTGTGNPHAVLWSGSAASMVDLHPPAFSGPNATSQVRAMDGGVQGGFIQDGFRHAALWHGSAQTFVDLNGSLVASDVYGMSGGQQVGSGNFPSASNLTHAVIWAGTPGSVLDLNPHTGLDSVLLSTTGEYQAGWAHVPGAGFPHAGLWNGTAASFVDLNQFLPPGYGNSSASSVQTVNGQLYVAGTAQSPTGVYEAWLWVGQVPAPGAGPVLLVGFVLALHRRRVRRS